MSKNKHYSRKDIPHCSTPQNLNINQNIKSINYNVSYSKNNNNNLYNSNLNPSNHFLKDSQYTNDNSSDIDFYSSSSSLKDQILSPGDDDLYLYVNYNSQNINNNNNINYPNKINNTYNNKQNYNNDFDYNYYLNFNINPKKYKSIDDMNKKTLILDLDETLVHSSFHPLYFNNEVIQPDIFFTILFENKSHDVYVLKRPYIKEFLNKMNKIFNIYIFTASIKEYAYPLLLKLDKNKLITKKLFRESCTLSKDNKFIKDLNVLNENLKNVILIDNNPNSYRYNKCNGLPIKTWHYDKNDKELIKIIPFLSFLSTVDDVREYIPKVVDDDQLNYNKINNILNLNLKQSNGSKNKKIINKIKKQKIINNNNNSAAINNNYSSSTGKIKYNPTYTNNEESKISYIGDQNRKIINLSCNKIINDNKDNNNFYTSKINFNQQEERKNNYHTVLNHRKSFHSPATINFREPLNHFQSYVYVGHKEQINNNIISSNISNNIINSNINNNLSNNISHNIINNGNININQMNKKEDNDNNKYQRSKSSNNFNELTKTMHKFTSINFNLVNSQSNNKKIKHNIDSKNIQNKNNNNTNNNSHNNTNNNSHNNTTNNINNNINNNMSNNMNNNMSNNMSNNKNEIHKIYENKNMTEKCLSYNNLMNDRINFSKLENSFYLDNNDQILVTYIQNNNINFNTNNNIMSINLKDESSKENLLYKPLKETRTQRNYSSVYNSKLFNQYKSENLIGNKNIINKKKINNKKDNEKCNNNNNDEEYWNNIDSKKSFNLRNKKIKKIRNNAYRNSDCNYNNKNYNKNIPISKTNDYNNKIKMNNILNNNNNNNNNNFDSINYKNYLDINNNDNNFSTFNKKVRSQTLNGHPISTHRISLNNKFEENKNCTMEISKNIKKKFYNNCLKDNNNINNYKINNNKYNNNNSHHHKNKIINYNISKQKNNKINMNIIKKNDLNNEINLLNKYMKDFNIKDPKEIINSQNMAKDMNTQRLPKMGNRKKNISSLINFNYYSEKQINSKVKNKKNEEEKKEKNNSKNDIFIKQNNEQDFNKDNFYANFYKRKNKQYIISKETNNYIKKKMKDINLEDYYFNDIQMESNTNENSDTIKNIKFLSLQKDKTLDKNEKMNNNERFFNNNKNSRRKANNSYGNKKSTKDSYSSRTINN